MASKSGARPFVTSFQAKTNLTSYDFLKIFKQFDKDGNGFIEAGELDEFLLALWKEGHSEKEPDVKEIASLKEEIMHKFDDNFDGRIDLEELTKILPTEENFLANFQNAVQLTSVDFFKVWTHYDVDRSGYIESEELEGFLVDLLGRDGQSLDPQRITDYRNAMLDLFDKNKDGKLSLSEMMKILPVEENFLKQFKERADDDQFNKIWSKYDQDGNGFIVDNELDALVFDLLSQNKGGDEDISGDEVKKFKAVIMETCDTNKDGKIGKDELKLLLVS